MECTDIFWHNFYRAAGLTLGALLPMFLALVAAMLLIFRQLHRHEERLQDARLHEEQVWESRYHVIQGGQG